jgi:acetylornithine deacetylase/succinyl-diaminopimelate desuccinylase-like protein
MKTLLVFAVLAIPTFLPRSLSAKNYDDLTQRVRKNIEAWVKADTTNPPGNENKVAQLAAANLKQADIPFEIVEFAPGRSNLVARLKGDGSEKPLLLIAHIDVVGTDGQKWTSDPHTVVEKDGYLTGRGVADDLGMASVITDGQKWTSDPHTVVEKDGYLTGRGVADDLGMASVITEILISLKNEKVPLRRDIIVALTGDEESGGAGTRFLFEKRPELLEAAIALNEGGGGQLGEDGKMKFLSLTSAEKTYQDFKIVAKGAPGHSAVPLADNAIYRLAKALDRIGQYRRPARLLPVTRDYLRQRSQVEKPKLAAAMKSLSSAKGSRLPIAALSELEKIPSLDAALRTTCVATTVTGGTRVNVLPSEASANVNCRILPDETSELIRGDLIKVIGDAKIEVQPVSDFGPGGTSPITGEVPSAVNKIAAESYPGVPVIPTLIKGTTDSRYLRRHGIAAYGMGPFAMAELDMHRVHGTDERISLASIRNGVEFFDKLVMELAAKK